MKTISLILAALLNATSPLLAQEAGKTPVTQNIVESTLTLGSEFVQAVRVKYQQGQYKEFLNEMSADYKKAKEETELFGLIEMRKEDAAIAAAHATDMDRWNSVANTWTQERNKDLLKAVDSESILGKKVRSIAASSDADEERAAAYFLKLRNLAPGAGKNSDENRLIEIDVESEYKQIHLDSLVSMGQTGSERREKQLALRMEKIDQMLEASKSFEDQSLKSMVELLAKTADERFAKGIDLTDLNNLARGKLIAATESEKKVASIISSYQGKFTDLTKEMFEQNSEARN